MNQKLHITVKGGRKIPLAGRIVEWTDSWGHHKGRVISYGNDSVFHVPSIKVFRVDCGADGMRELRAWEMRDIVSHANKNG